MKDVVGIGEIIKHNAKHCCDANVHLDSPRYVLSTEKAFSNHYVWPFQSEIAETLSSFMLHAHKCIYFWSIVLRIKLN